MFTLGTFERGTVLAILLCQFEDFWEKAMIKRVVTIVGTLVISMVATAEPVFTDYVRDDVGRVKYVSRLDARYHCETQGARLPSARELAQLFMSNGAKGIVRACETAQDCKKINKIKNVDGSSDEFFFDKSGYQRPDDQSDIIITNSKILGPRSGHPLWTSSVGSDAPGYSGSIFIGLTNDGSIHHFLVFEYYAAARCVRDR